MDEPCSSSQTLGYAAHLLAQSAIGGVPTSWLASLQPMALSSGRKFAASATAGYCRELGYQAALNPELTARAIAPVLAEELSGSRRHQK